MIKLDLKTISKNQKEVLQIQLIKLGEDKHMKIHDDIASLVYKKKKELLELEISLDSLNKDNDFNKYLHKS